MKTLNWILLLIGTVRSMFQSTRNLALENLALRQQLAVFKHQYPRPALHRSDRAFWVFLSRFWPDWCGALHIVAPKNSTLLILLSFSVREISDSNAEIGVNLDKYSELR